MTDIPVPTVRRVPYLADEKEMLYVALDRHRDAIVWKLEGLTDEQLRRVMTPSGTSLLGLLKHLAFCEYGWFCDTFGRLTDLMPNDDDDPEADLTITTETTEEIFAFYERARRAADDVINDLPIETVGKAWYGPEVNLRWVLIHMIEENARHAGHIDIVRELIDGHVGSFPILD